MKKALSILLAMILCVGLLPFAAFASEEPVILEGVAVLESADFEVITSVEDVDDLLVEEPALDGTNNSWSDAYKAFVDNHPDYNYSLHDLDRNGTPELVCINAPGMLFYDLEVYAFISGTVKKIGSEYVRMLSSVVYSNGGDCPGLFVTYNSSGYRIGFYMGIHSDTLYLSDYCNLYPTWSSSYDSLSFTSDTLIRESFYNFFVHGDESGISHLPFSAGQSINSSSGWETFVATYSLESNSQPALVSGKTGWEKSGGKWYYYKDGVKQTGWLTLDGTTYYFDASGVMQTGWVKFGNDWYYFKSSGALTRSAWLKSGGSWYWFESGGRMATGLQTIDGALYYFLSSGAMKTGWVQISGSWYYFKSSGVATKSAWLKSGGSWYWFDTNGRMVTGRQQIDGTWYTFADSGKMQ